MHRQSSSPQTTHIQTANRTTDRPVALFVRSQTDNQLTPACFRHCWRHIKNRDHRSAHDHKRRTTSEGAGWWTTLQRTVRLPTRLTAAATKNRSAFRRRRPSVWYSNRRQQQDQIQDDEMESRLSTWTQQVHTGVCVSIPSQQCTLKKQHAGIPNGRSSAERWQYHSGKQWLNQKQERRAQENSQPIGRQQSHRSKPDLG